MKHFAAPEFRVHYGRLPPEVRALADKNFTLLKLDLRHASVRLKKMGAFWSARVGLHCRAALAREQAEGLAWFWIGPHAAYDHYP